MSEMETITLKCESGPVKELADVEGGLAVHRDVGGDFNRWVVTHVASGLGMRNQGFATPVGACAFRCHLLTLGFWLEAKDDADVMKRSTKQDRSEARRVGESIRLTERRFLEALDGAEATQ